MTVPEHEGLDVAAELGLNAGLNALNPLEVFSKAFGSAVDQDARKQFLGAYLEGVSQFFEGRGLVMPIGSHMEDILQPQGLSGFIKGLNRKKPNPQKELNPPSGEYTDPDTWAYTLSVITQQLYSEGYFLGFMIGLVRDCGLNLNQVEVPKDDAQYELFNRGLNAQPRKFTSLIGANFVSGGDQRIAIKLENWIYEGGLKLWLHQQGLDINLANKISHPEALAGFKGALDGDQIENEEVLNETPQSIGFELGQEARQQLGRDKVS